MGKSEADNEFQGLTFNKSHVSVHWKGRRGTTVRFETVRVPWSSFTENRPFMEALGNVVARELREVWDMSSEENPLFELPK